MAQVVFDHVTKKFGGVVALNDFHMEVRNQEFLVLVGPPGCGKSTALRLLSGMENISEGNIVIGEALVNKVASKDRDIATVFESYTLLPRKSLYDNVAQGLRKASTAEGRRRVIEAAQILGIEDLLDLKPDQVSRGQALRVVLGKAIVGKPAVFLFDEPLSNLDAKLRVQTRAEMIRLHRRLSATFIYATQDHVEAMAMATRMAVMSEGTVQQIGAPQELYSRPDNVFVAGFTGSSGMNFFDVKLTGTVEEMYVDAGSFQALVPDSKAQQLEPFLGKRLVLGVRPENIHDKEYHPQGIMASPIEAKVDVIEPVGSETFLHVLNGDHSFLARVDPRTSARPGHEAALVLDMSHLHAFDPETKRSMLP